MSEKIQIFYNEQYIGKLVDVLIEEEEEGYYKGHTNNYLLVKTKANSDLTNKIISVKIEKCKKMELFGENVTKM